MILFRIITIKLIKIKTKVQALVKNLILKMNKTNNKVHKYLAAILANNLSPF